VSYNTRAQHLNLVRLVTRYSRLWHLIRYHCWPLVLNFLTELAIHLQWCMEGARSTSPWAGGALANPHDYLQCIRMPHAKFRTDLLKTLAVHKEEITVRQTGLVLYI